jgi:hypothetical protein
MSTSYTSVSLGKRPPSPPVAAQTGTPPSYDERAFPPLPVEDVVFVRNPDPPQTRHTPAKKDTFQRTPSAGKTTNKKEDDWVVLDSADLGKQQDN